MDVFQTTATALVLAKEIIDFIERYHTAFKDAQQILIRIKESESVLKRVKHVVEERSPSRGSQETEVIAQIALSVKSCHALLSKVKVVLEKNLDSKRFERTRLVFGRKSLMEMQNELANHINILHLMLSVLSTLDAADIRAGITRILKALNVQIDTSENALATSDEQGATINCDDGPTDQDITEKNALAQHIEDTRLDDGREALAQWIKKARSVHDSLRADGAPDTGLESEDEGSLPQHTPSGANTPLEGPQSQIEDRSAEAQAMPQLEPEKSIDHLTDDMLQNLIFKYRNSAKDEARESHFNQAEISMRQAIVYAEQLELRGSTEQKMSRVLQEELSSIFQKHGQWNESLVLLTALLTSDTGSESVEIAWHNQLLGAAYFGKDREGESPSDPETLEKATAHTLKAFNFRNDAACSSREELERQKMCVELLVNIYRRRNLKEEADMFAEKLPMIRDVTSDRSSRDHGGPDRAAITHEARLDLIAQATEKRKQGAMQRLGPYEAADIEALDKDQVITLFFAVIKCSDRESVECLLTQAKVTGLADSIDPGKDKERRTALHVAARQNEDGHLHVIRSLLNHDADIDAQDEDGRTALIQAVDSSNIEAAKLLLDHGANKEIVDDDGWSILHYAVHLDDIQMLKALLRRAPGLTNFTDQVEDTPLHHAVRQERVDVVKTYCEESQDLDINVANTAGHYPLYLAAAHPLTDRRHKVFEELIRQGAVCDEANPPPYFKDYQTLSKARRLSDVSVATTLTGGSDRGSPPRAGFLRRVLTAGSARA